jgi:flagellar biosynthesis activator protein FlaF
MQQAASAYSKVAQATQSPRELEAAVLMKAASKLQAIRDDWSGKRPELFEALAYNRKLSGRSSSARRRRRAIPCPQP